MKYLVAVLCLSGAAAFAEAPQPEGFRGPPYQAELPTALTGARTIDADEAQRLHAEGAAFIDVYPRQKKPQNLPEHTVWRAEPHLTIPDALWLYDTGYERLKASEQSRLEVGLAEASGGDFAAPLVIFCRADCWMSWNAAKRAVALGYKQVLWFPEGTEGWEGTGGMLVPAAIYRPGAAGAKP